MAIITLDRSAEDIARALNGRREGRGWMARCPAHDNPGKAWVRIQSSFLANRS